MQHFIGYQSAIEHWRKHRRLPAKKSGGRLRALSLPKEPVDTSNIDAVGLELPLHALVGDPNARRPSSLIQQHVFTRATPVGCFVKWTEDLAISSPEFCFLQMAGVLTLVQLIMLGYELCGTYSLPNPNDMQVPVSGFYKRPALTSKKKLEAFLARLPNVIGHKKALRALHYILDGSASPMETNLTMLLSLPPKMGGYGFALPKLNVRIDLPKPARMEIGKAFLVCDLFWLEHNIAVEYDSNIHHTGPKRIAEDSKRRNYLTSIGIKTIVVTSEQIKDVTSLEAVSRLLAGNMGRRMRHKNTNYIAARQELRRQLA